jgi:hypothetical protein
MARSGQLFLSKGLARSFAYVSFFFGGSLALIVALLPYWLAP